MLTSRRKAHILDRLRRDGQAVAKTIAAELGLSEDTIRRDMREMAAEGLVRRVHGGAMPVAAPLPDLSARQAIARDAKAGLAEAAAALIEPGQTVFLDGGTTTAAIAGALPRTLSAVIATHAPTIAALFCDHPRIEVVMIGGRLYRHSMVAVGRAAAEQIERLRPDIFLLGATAVHPAHGATTGDFEEAAIKRQIAAMSGATYLPVTVEKIDRISPHVVMPLARLSGLIVPSELPQETVFAYETAGARLIRAAS